MSKAPPGFLGIEVSLVETRLERFNDDGDKVDFKFKLRVTYSDPRIALLDGEYRLSQVDMLVEERRLWLPEPILAGFETPVFTKTVQVTGTQVVYEVGIRGFKNAVANYNFYPFDPQDAELLVSFAPGIKWLSPLPTTETSTCDDPGDGWIVGRGLQAQLGTTAGSNRFGEIQAKKRHFLEPGVTPRLVKLLFFRGRGGDVSVDSDSSRENNQHSEFLGIGIPRKIHRH